MTLKHKIKGIQIGCLLLGGVLILVLSGLFITSNKKTLGANLLETHELLYQVTHVEEAEKLALKHDLTVEQISKRGIATFRIGALTDVDALLEMGFTYNSLSEVQFRGGPPWQRTRNYIDEQYALEMMETFAAWSLTTGHEQVTVAVIDTGIDINHVEFIGRISALSYNAVIETVGLEAVIDDHGHGTMVAGVIAADQTNDEGIAGIVQEVSLLVIKANETEEGRFRDSALIEGIYYAVEQGADVINLSLGGPYANPLTEAALAYAAEQGVIVIGAAGNSGTDTPKYPASFETVLSVSAVDASRALADFSNFGPNIVLSAPGADIVTTVRNNGYGTVSGTSFAAPQVTGVVALMLSYLGDLSVDEVHERLFLTAMDEGEAGWDPYFGHGIVNTYQALSANLVTVTFETFNGTKIEPYVLVLGSQLGDIDDPELSDHVFEGWYLDSQFTEPFSLDQPITESLTLYAKFNASFHTVRFVTEGEAISNLVVAHGETFDVPESVLEEHVFTGWYTDSARINPYTGDKVMADLTLYARFEPITYFDVVWVIDGEIVLTQTVEEGTQIEAMIYTKEGHQFDGWYLDEALTKLFLEMPVTEDITLYGQFVPLLYSVMLMDGETLLETLEVPYGTIFIPDDPVQDSLSFVAWYRDSDFTNRYEPTSIEAPLTLYARFADEIVTVTYVVEEFEEKTVSFALGDTPTLWQPEKQGFTFLGWYLDEALTVPYTMSTLTEDIRLYASFEPNEVTVRFMDYDGQTVIFEVHVLAGTSVTAPEGPDKPSDNHFTYAFKKWSVTTEAVLEDTVVIPLYTKTFITGSIGLQPGVDTISIGDVWEDSGLLYDNDRFDVVVNTPLDVSTPGKYVIHYDIFLDGEHITSMRRHVRVVQPFIPIEIVLNPGITTIVVGGRYQEAGATANDHPVEVIGTVDTTIPGVYQIIYRVTLNGSIFEKIRNVHVIEVNDFTEVALGVISKSRKGSAYDVA